MSGTPLRHLVQLSNTRFRADEDGRQLTVQSAIFAPVSVPWVHDEEEWMLLRMGSARLDM